MSSLFGLLFFAGVIGIALLVFQSLFTITVQTKATDSGSGNVVQASTPYSYPTEVKVDAAVAANAVATPFATANWTQAKAQLIIFNSDQNVTLYTNSNNGTGGNTFNILQGVPLVWQANGYTTNPFTHDVTAGIFVTNANNVVANIDLIVLCSQ